MEHHKSREDRLDAAKVLLDDFPMDCQVIVDDMNDEAMTAYGALPERLYVLYNGKVVYEGGVGPFFYSLDEVKTVLDKVLEGTTTEEDLHVNAGWRTKARRCVSDWLRIYFNNQV